MKIAKLELFKVPPRWLFLKITTDDGLSGWGEPIVEGRADTVAACVEELSEFLIGKPAGNIEDFYQMIYRGGFYRGGPVLMSAISGIDQALWDIKGKYFNAPIHQLIGGRARDTIKLYTWIGGDRSSDVAGAVTRAEVLLNLGREIRNPLLDLSRPGFRLLAKPGGLSNTALNFFCTRTEKLRRSL